VSCVDRMSTHARTHARTHAGGHTTPYIAMRPRACINVRRLTQCERGFLDCRQSRRVVSNIGVGYRPCHFLDI